MAARTRRTRLDEAWRERIRASHILGRLLKHLDGALELTPTQIRAAEILLKKIVPDLSAIEHSGEVTQFVQAADLSDDRLADIASGGSKRIAAPAPGESESPIVH